MMYQTKLEDLLKELDNECTVVYKNGQEEEFKVLNKIYGMLRKYIKVYNSATYIDVEVILYDKLDRHLYELIINWYELAISSLRNKNDKFIKDKDIKLGAI